VRRATYKKKPRRVYISPSELPELNLREIVPKICDELGLRRSGKLVNILCNLDIDGRRFKFTYNDKSFFKIYVKCPKCKDLKLNLYKVEDEYACKDCHFIHKNRLRKTHRNTVFYTRYIRPLKKLAELENLLFSTTITVRQRQIYEKKAAKLRKVIPEYILAMREQIMQNLDL